MAVAFDAVGPSASGTGLNSSTNTNLQWNHTCSGSNRLLIVGVGVGTAVGSDNLASVSVTYNSVSMTAATVGAPISANKVHSNNSTAGYIQIFYLIAPATGTNQVSVSLTTSVSTDVVAGSLSFTGADQTTGVSNTVGTFGDGSVGTASLSVTSATGNMVADVFCTGTGLASGTSKQTLEWHNDFGSGSGASNVAQSVGNGASSVTVGYDNFALDWWGLIGTNIIAAASTPTVTTQAVTNVAGTTATGNGTVVSDGGSTITERGVVWSTSANPTTSDNKASTSGTTGAYSVNITGLTSGTTYHLRAYAINANGTSYGSDVTFQPYAINLGWIRA